jgi:hypothetical protein
MPAKTKQVTDDVLVGCSGKGWAASKGLYSCGANRAKVLVARGYARKVTAGGSA